MNSQKFKKYFDFEISRVDCIGKNRFAHTTELQIRQITEDNSKIIFLFLNENICCDPLLEPSQRDCSNGGTQNMFLIEKHDLLSQITPVTPCYLEHCIQI